MIFVIKYPAYIEFLLQIWHNIFRKEVQSHLFSEWRAHMEIKRDIYEEVKSIIFNLHLHFRWQTR